MRKQSATYKIHAELLYLRTLPFVHTPEAQRLLKEIENAARSYRRWLVAGLILPGCAIRIERAARTYEGWLAAALEYAELGHYRSDSCHLCGQIKAYEDAVCAACA